MAEIRWRHGQSADSARAVIEQEVLRAGYPDKLRWKGNAFSAQVGFGTVLRVSGQVTDQEIVIDQCNGLLANVAKPKIEEALGRLFPAGHSSEREAPLACQSR